MGNSEPKCVLIVDDHAGVRRALRSLFASGGFEVCGEAVNGRDGIEKAQELQPDLILLDLSMPIMNGLEAARELMRLMPHVPVLMVTNHAESLRSDELRQAGIRAVIAKDDAYTKLIRSAREFSN